jgi:endoglucanase
MKKMSMLAMFLAITLFGGVGISNATPVENHGQLKVVGNKIVDENNKTVVLRGMSLFWGSFQEGLQFWRSDVITALATDWNATVVRLPVGVEEGIYAYENGATTQLTKTRSMIDAAIAAGIYVIVDWHAHKAHNNAALAKSFLRQLPQSIQPILTLFMKYTMSQLM